MEILVERRPDRTSRCPAGLFRCCAPLSHIVIEIQPAETPDIDGIRAVATAAWHAAHASIVGAETVEEFLEEYYDAKSFQERIEREVVLLDVATASGDGVVGYVMANPGDEEPATFTLTHIYVTPDRWGEGIGQQLLDHVVGVACDRGRERVGHGVVADNERAVDFYEAAGFIRSDEFYDDRIDARGYTYVKELARADASG